MESKQAVSNQAINLNIVQQLVAAKERIRDTRACVSSVQRCVCR
jgi:hypothetical protein